MRENKKHSKIPRRRPLPETPEQSITTPFINVHVNGATTAKSVEKQMYI